MGREPGRGLPVRGYWGSLSWPDGGTTEPLVPVEPLALTGARTRQRPTGRRGRAGIPVMTKPSQSAWGNGRAYLHSGATHPISVRIVGAAAPPAGPTWAAEAVAAHSENGRGHGVRLSASPPAPRAAAAAEAG